MQSRKHSCKRKANKVKHFDTLLMHAQHITAMEQKHRESMLSSLVLTNKHAYNMLQKFRLVAKLLDLVARGAQDRAEIILNLNPRLLLEKGQVIDPAGRIFNDISAFQYALWALDTRHMCGIMFDRVFNSDLSSKHQNQIRIELLEQYNAVIDIGLDYKLGSVEYTRSHNYDVKQLIDALIEYDQLYADLNYTKLDKYWIEVVGGAQKLLTAIFTLHYTDPDLAFYPTPNFTFSPFNRSGRVYNNFTNTEEPWFALSLDENMYKLGVDFAIFRAASSEASTIPELRWLLGHNINVPIIDANALQKLRDVRLTDRNNIKKFLEVTKLFEIELMQHHTREQIASLLAGKIISRFCFPRKFCYAKDPLLMFDELVLRIKNNLAIKQLDIAEINAQVCNFKHFADSLQWNNHLVVLNFTRSNIDDSAIEALAKSLSQNNFLLELNLYGNQISCQGAKHIACMLEQNKILEELLLDANTIGDAGLVSLGIALQSNTTLKVLSLDSDYYCKQSNLYSDRSILQFLQTMQQYNLSDLRMCFKNAASSNVIQQSLAQTFKQQLIVNNKLKYLSLSFIAGTILKSIVDAMQYNRTISELNIRESKFTDEELSYLANKLKSTDPLQYLKIPITTDNGVAIICDAVSNSYNLQTLRLSNIQGKRVSLKKKNSDSIANLIKQNKSLTTLIISHKFPFAASEYIIAKSLKYNSSLTDLKGFSLYKINNTAKSDCKINKVGSIMHFLKSIQTLLLLQLSTTPITVLANIPFELVLYIADFMAPRLLFCDPRHEFFESRVARREAIKYSKSYFGRIVHSLEVFDSSDRLYAGRTDECIEGWLSKFS